MNRSNSEQSANQYYAPPFSSRRNAGVKNGTSESQLTQPTVASQASTAAFVPNFTLVPPLSFWESVYAASKPEAEIVYVQRVREMPNAVTRTIRTAPLSQPTVTRTVRPMQRFHNVTGASTPPIDVVSTLSQRKNPPSLSNGATNIDTVVSSYTLPKKSVAAEFDSHMFNAYDSDEGHDNMSDSHSGSEDDETFDDGVALELGNYKSTLKIVAAPIASPNVSSIADNPLVRSTAAVFTAPFISFLSTLRGHDTANIHAPNTEPHTRRIASENSDALHPISPCYAGSKLNVSRGRAGSVSSLNTHIDRVVDAPLNNPATVLKSSVSASSDSKSIYSVGLSSSTAIPQISTPHDQASTCDPESEYDLNNDVFDGQNITNTENKTDSTDFVTSDVVQVEPHGDDNVESWVNLDEAAPVVRTLLPAFFRYAFACSLTIQLAYMLLVYAMDPLSWSRPCPYPVVIFMAALMQLGQIAFAIVDSVRLIAYLLHSVVHPIVFVNMYLTNVTMFTGMYSFCALINPTAFILPELINPTDSTMGHVFSSWVAMFYFSSTTMTTTGFGDILPSLWYSKVIAAMEMFVNIVYTTFLFSIGVNHFRLAQQRRTSIEVELERAELQLEAWWQFTNFVFFRFPRLEALRKFVVEQILFVTVLMQVIELVILETIDHDILNAPETGWRSATVMLLFQVLQLILIVTISIKLARQLNSDAVASNFLIQSYLSTIVVFAGLFFLIFALTGRESFQLYEDGEDANRSLQLDMLSVATQMVWFSLVNMTTTGYGGSVPLGILTRLVATVQQQMSVLYTVVILGMGMSVVINKLESARKIVASTSLSEARFRSRRTPRRRRSTVVKSDADDFNGETIFMQNISETLQRTVDTTKPGLSFISTMCPRTTDSNQQNSSVGEVEMAHPETLKLPHVRSTLLSKNEVYGLPLEHAQFGVANIGSPHLAAENVLSRRTADRGATLESFTKQLSPTIQNIDSVGAKDIVLPIEDHWTNLGPRHSSQECDMIQAKPDSSVEQDLDSFVGKLSAVIELFSEEPDSVVYSPRPGFGGKSQREANVFGVSVVDASNIHTADSEFRLRVDDFVRRTND